MSDSGWTGQTPDELAQKIARTPFASMRETVMQQIVHVALGHAQKLTPVRTGLLRRSETTRVEPGGLRGYVGTNVVYAPYVHARVPFFEMAIADSQAEIQRLLQAAGDDYFAEVVK